MSGCSPDGHGQAPDSDVAELLAALGVPLGAEYLERALMHRSFAYENGGLPTNERLEFLGDSVLGLIVTDTLFQSFPDLPEGQLAKLRAAVVNMRALAGVARGLRLGAAGRRPGLEDLPAGAHRGRGPGCARVPRGRERP